MKKILIIGAGTVGQTYAWALDRAGADVHFYLKLENIEAAKKGFYLYHLNQDPKKIAPIELKNFKILTQTEEVLAQEWDQIYLAISSTALRSLWIKKFAPSTINARMIIMLQAGVKDREYLLPFFPPSKLLSGTIPFIAYSTPLPHSNEVVSPAGTAFYFPPFAQSFLSGPENLAREAAHLLKRGGIATKYSKIPAIEKISYGNGLLIAIVSQLEQLHWSLRNLSQSSELKLLVETIQEIIPILSAEWKTPSPRILKWIAPTHLKFLLSAATKILPFKLEPYLQAHFTKVSDQTRQMVTEWIEIGQSHGLSVKKLERLVPARAKEPEQA